MSSTPFVAAQGGVAAGSSLVLNIVVSTQNGDNLILGVTINSTPAVPRVTDTQGNTWSGVVTDTTETGAQIWTFESPGASALVAGTDTITITVTQT